MQIKDYCSYSKVFLADGRFVEIVEHEHSSQKTWVHIIKNGLVSGGEWIQWNSHLATAKEANPTTQTEKSAQFESVQTPLGRFQLLELD